MPWNHQLHINYLVATDHEDNQPKIFDVINYDDIRGPFDCELEGIHVGEIGQFHAAFHEWYYANQFVQQLEKETLCL